MSIARIILATIYALIMAWGIYFYQRIPSLLLIVVAGCSVTILALTGKVGNWARIGAMLFVGLTLLQGIKLTASGVWQFYSGIPDTLLSIIAGLIYAAISAWTIWLLLPAKDR